MFAAPLCQRKKTNPAFAILFSQHRNAVRKFVRQYFVTLSSNLLNRIFGTFDSIKSTPREKKEAILTSAPNRNHIFRIEKNTRRH